MIATKFTIPEPECSDHAIAGLAALLVGQRAKMLRFLLARCGDPDLAEDFYQELWIKVATQTCGPIANEKGYLFRMANNLVLDHRKRKWRAMARDRRWIAVGMPDELPIEHWPAPDMAADEMIGRNEELAVLRRAIAALPPCARRALTLYRFEEHSQSEVAAIMGISVSCVEKHLSLAMKRLREQMMDEDACLVVGA